MANGLQKIFVTPLDSVRATTEQRDPLGTIRFEGAKVYKYCLLKASPTADVDAVTGDMAIYTDYSASEVGADLDDQEAEMTAGIFLATIDMSADSGKYVWVQIKGLATVAQTIGNSAAAGDSISGIGTGVADKTFTKRANLLDQYCGVMIATTEVSLECPF